MGKATEDLRREHEAILHVIDILDKVMAAGTAEAEKKLSFFNELINFLAVFAIQCHHGKEEGYLYPALINKGITDEGWPLDAMMREHRLGRDYIKAMGEAVESGDVMGLHAIGKKFHELLFSHIGKENDTVLITADQLLDEAMQNELYRKFAEHEERVAGHGVHKQLHAMVGRWAAEYLAV